MNDKNFISGHPENITLPNHEKGNSGIWLFINSSVVFGAAMTVVALENVKDPFLKWGGIATALASSYCLHTKIIENERLQERIENFLTLTRLQQSQSFLERHASEQKDTSDLKAR